MKTLLVVYHSQTGHTEALVRAVVRGASAPDVEAVRVSCRRALDAGPEELLACDGLVLGTPENCGYMSGGLKDFLDRTYYPAQGRVEGLPYAVVISAGNDGTGALAAIRRIARGYPLREIHEPLIVRGVPAAAHLRRCEELGLAFAAGLELGLF